MLLNDMVCDVNFPGKNFPPQDILYPIEKTKKKFNI